MEEELKYKVSSDSDGRPLEGERNYKFHLSQKISARDYWSVIVYDNKTSLMIKTNQLWPSVYSTRKGLEVNPDGSVDAWFSSLAPDGKENNWIKLIPGRGWHMILRIYGPLEILFDGISKPLNLNY